MVIIILIYYSNNNVKNIKMESLTPLFYDEIKLVKNTFLSVYEKKMKFLTDKIERQRNVKEIFMFFFFIFHLFNFYLLE